MDLKLNTIFNDKNRDSFLRQYPRISGLFDTKLWIVRIWLTKLLGINTLMS